MTPHSFALSKASATATPEEAAAITAAIERFVRATAPGPSHDAPAATDDWHGTALLEGVERDPWATPTNAWLGASELPPG